MTSAVGLKDGLGLDGDRCIRVIPRQQHRAVDWITFVSYLFSNHYRYNANEDVISQLISFRGKLEGFLDEWHFQ